MATGIQAAPSSETAARELDHVRKERQAFRLQYENCERLEQQHYNQWADLVMPADANESLERIQTTKAAALANLDYKNQQVSDAERRLDAAVAAESRAKHNADLQQARDLAARLAKAAEPIDADLRRLREHVGDYFRIAFLLHNKHRDLTRADVLSSLDFRAAAYAAGGRVLCEAFDVPILANEDRTLTHSVCAKLSHLLFNNSAQGKQG